MSENKRRQLIDEETLDIMEEYGSLIDRKKINDLISLVSDADCVHPFLLFENRRKAKKIDCSVYYCFECSSYVELTLEETLIRNVFYNFDKKFVIEQYKEHRQNYGNDISYVDFNKIMNQITLADMSDKRSKSK